MKRVWLREVISFILVGALAAMAGCSGSTKSGGGGGGGSTSNVQAITVNSGPGGGYFNGAFTSVTVCVPGSTTNCQTIGGILVDTGSPGLRILSSALTISLPQQTGSSGNPIVECLPFLSGFTWGPVQTTDMTIAGEHAKSLPIQVIGTSSFSTIPASCSSNGKALEDLATLGANGILGVGILAQDCGSACTVSGASNPGFYYSCPSSGCVVTTESLASQVQNPVALFATDNNGVLIDLPSVSGAQTSVAGSLIFGIGTQSNNGLGSAAVYMLDPSTGNITSVFNGHTYTDAAFIDSGSNGIYFLDAATTAIPTCAPPIAFWYCPTSTQNLSATNRGTNGTSASFNFFVGNANTLTSSASTAAANGLAGPNIGTSGMLVLDWGLPFFYGRKVFTAIEGQNSPGGVGPYWAY
ncbi:MAG TPA: DUF3443 domain-containing protein [Candidatus Acidoferrum sp.]|nr:DUF3443 domain-containing protein [Candidatus Acidoferrum sp.]